jgi:hypothetical protein
MPTQSAITQALLERHGQSFASELGINIEKNTPSPLFRLLCFSLLAGSRISADISMQAAKTLAEQGWTTADNMAESTWRQRTNTLNRAGYARYDESTSRMLGATVDMLVAEYGGDLRKLRQRADNNPKTERKLLKQCKGIGDVGVDIFMREAQVAWDELYPFADKLSLRAANKLGLGKDASALTRHVKRTDFSRLIAALVRCEMASDHDAIIAEAR